MGVATRNKFVRTTCDRFYEKCAPCSKPFGGPSASPNFEKVFETVPSDPGVEKDLYEPLRKAITRLCPGYICKTTSENYDANDLTKQKVDLVLFRKRGAPKNGGPNWSQQALHIEVKRNSIADDPFDDTEGVVFQLNTTRRSENRDQITSYADMLFRWQHRAFCFTVIVFGQYARIIRWDRSGAVVTERIDYLKNPAQLADFFSRFARMTPEEQGYDTTVTPVKEGSEDAKKIKRAFEKKLKVRDYAREKFKESFQDLKNFPMLKISVNVETMVTESSDRPASPYKEYLVGEPRYAVNNIVGRCTHGYVALDADTEELVWLKDAWRVDSPGIDREGDTLQELNGASVQHVPTFICHGDVPGQDTMADKEWAELYGFTDPLAPQAKAPTNPLKAHTHYRLVVKEVCLPLDDWRGSELVAIILYCLIAHRQAYEKLCILHRDISSGNVLICEKSENGKIKRVGILADWELAKKVQKGASLHIPARQPDRTGTWQFLSALSLRNSLKPITLQDDLESFHHLITYEGVRWIPNTCIDVAAFMHHYFDGTVSYSPSKEFVCGDAKFSAMEKGSLEYLGSPIQFHSGHLAGMDKETYPLTQLLQDSAGLFVAYYQVVKHDFPDLYAAPVVQDVVDSVPATASASEDESQASVDLNDFEAELDPDVQRHMQKSTGNESTDADALDEYHKTAEKLSKHHHLINLLGNYLKKQWPEADKLHHDKRQPLDQTKLDKALAESDQVLNNSRQESSAATKDEPKRASSSSKSRGRRAPQGPSTTSASTSSKRAHGDFMSGGGGGDQPLKRYKMDGVGVPPAPYLTSMPPPPIPSDPVRTMTSHSAEASRSSSRLRSRGQRRSPRRDDYEPGGSSSRRSSLPMDDNGSHSGRQSPRPTKSGKGKGRV